MARKGWAIPPGANGQFVAAIEEVLDVCKRPYARKYPVVCMDESPKQLIRETRVPIKMRSGQSARHDFEYERCGVCNLFMVNEPLVGKRNVKVTERKTKLDWAELIREIADDLYPKAAKITLVMDNLATHKPGALYEAFLIIPRKGLPTGRGKKDMGSIRFCIHAQARELVEHGRNRIECPDKAMPQTQDRQYGDH